MSIVIQNVSKQFGTFQALDRVSLNLTSGKLFALLGPSGSGKSTLLRAIAGLEIPDSGTIHINGQDTTHLDIRQRNIGFVFQHYALFKHLTVSQNIAFGLEIRKVPRRQISVRVEELVKLIQLQGLGDRYPSQLSGGQRQRVALARALAVQPQVLLLDEPFGALDAKVRKELRSWLRRLHDEVGITSVFVTHDQEEAMEVADEVAIMNQGHIEQVGSPAEIYDQPATPFVMNFVGDVNVFPPTPVTTRWFQDYYSHQQTSGDTQKCLTFTPVFVRPHDLEVQTLAHGNSPLAQLKRIAYLGREVQLELLLPDNLTVNVHLSRDQFNDLKLQPEQQVYLKPRNAKVFSSNSSRVVVL